jgi:hypothetical protein
LDEFQDRSDVGFLDYIISVVLENLDRAFRCVDFSSHETFMLLRWGIRNELSTFLPIFEDTIGHFTDCFILGHVYR